MKKVLTVLVAAGFLLAPTAAHASGSDSPTPYEVTAEGVTLPAGQVFQDGGHVNVRTNQGNANLHFEDRNWPVDHPKRAYIGKGSVPWSAFGFDPATLCVEWVQIHGFNEHFGEGGQSPVGAGCMPDEVETSEEEAVDCDARTVSTTTRERVNTYERAKEGGYVLVPGEWVKTGETLRDATEEECPPPGAEYWTGETRVTDCVTGMTEVTAETFRYDYYLEGNKWVRGDAVPWGVEVWDEVAQAGECDHELPASGGGADAALLALGAVLIAGGLFLTFRPREVRL